MGKKSAGHYRLCEGFSYAGASFHLFIVTREMAIQRSSCHLLLWTHTIQMPFAPPGMNDIVLRIIE